MEAEYHCIRCQTPFVTRHPLDEEGVCAFCRAGGNSFDTAYSFGSYEGTLQKLIHLYKYSGMYTLAKPLAKYMIRSLPEAIPIDVVAPVPMHWWRKWNRGYNQSQLLAKEVAQAIGKPASDILRRKKWTAPQAGLSNHDRRENLRNVFEVSKPLHGRHVLLVDDVLTTGATVSGCAGALKRAGAAGVVVLTLARADRRVWIPEQQARVKSTNAGGW